MGSLLSGFFESMGSGVRADSDDLMLDDAIEQGSMPRSRTTTAGSLRNGG
ncbi:enoyl-CoA hydratase domain protein [Mycobacterium kansasii]|uniref:Enoyl-CoA hydratase domain protein n=1 Tax=Mycobacterium kansasii TaxID=1768 RepID=A0A1V3WUE9_MYCKA|nr:enoyl-CoA hydratase domain protein [Mycobacterium kansasii]